MEQFGLNQYERLKSRKAIGELFDSGNSFFAFPFKVVYTKVDCDDAVRCQAAFSVSKRNFKKAVDRNRIKRLMREAYRLDKNLLQRCMNSKQCRVMFIYTARELFPAARISNDMKKAITRLSERI